MVMHSDGDFGFIGGELRADTLNQMTMFAVKS